MAQNTLDLTFTKVSASEATVNVAGNGIDANGITADVKANVDWKTLTADSETFPNASMLCPDRNTKDMTAGNEGVFTITLNNVPEGYSFKNVTFTSAALNGSGAFQGDNANAQPVNFTLKQGETVLGTAENVLIKVNSDGGEFVTVPFEVAEAYTATEGTLELTLTLSVTESKGCFYGLTKISIETEAATVEPEPSVETFVVEAALFPAPQGDITEIKGIRVEANQGASLSELPTTWTLTNEAGTEFAMSTEWLYDWATVLLMINPAITEAGTYTLTIPAGSLKTDDGKECEAAEFSWTIVATVEPEPEPEATYYRIKTTTATGDAIYLNIGNTDEHQTGPKGGVNIVAYAEDDNQLFTIEEAGEGNIYLKSKSGYYIKGWAWNVDGSASQKSELEFEDAGEGTFYIKGENGYFKVEYVSDAYYPFCDAPISAAAKWTLEQVGAVEPELPALEITGYTPTEAVEKLETITITFNDEIEGTFDVMNMTQIYLGSRSNGCSFAVEGNVLTITPFNAITTPGEYGLVIPEGLITRKANGEKISMNKEIVFTVKEATVEPEPENLVKIYHITAKDTNRGALYATAESTHLTHCGATYGNYHNKDVAVNAEDINQQFVFVEYEGKTYLYSLGAKKFAVKEKQYIKLVESPEGFVTVEDADAEGYKIIFFNGQNRLNFSGGYDHGCVANYETPDDGNRLALTEVGQYDATELLASIEAYFKAKAEALAAARAAFNAKYAEAQAILAEAALSVVDSELPLQVTDATAAAYIWSNKPEPNEGPIAQLVDGIVEEGNFFHTNWSDGNEQPRYHYIEVDLGEGNGLAEFSFKYTTRFAVANDYPDAIQIMGSNDGENYTEVANITSGLPQTGGTQWTSNIISSETAYRYLRFNVDAERTYWHMSEFDIVTSEISVAEKYAAVANSVVALDNAFKAAADNADYTAEELYAAAAAINAAIVEIYKDEATVALIATAKELIALEGIGYPAAAPRAELQAAIDAAEAMPNTEAGTALQAAINAYYAATDVVLPENGKVYTFKAVYGNNKFYIYNNNGTLAVAACGDEELPESAKFICEYDSEEDFMFQFKTADGAYYLAYPTLGGKGWLDNESETGLEATSSRVTKFNINKILAGGEVAASNEALLGLVQMDGYRGYDNGKYVDSYGPIVVKHSAATFDGASAPYYNENFTSAFCIEESEVVVTPLSVVAVTPAEEVTSLREITIEFDAEIAVDSVNVRACTIDYGWGVIIGTTATVEGNVLTLVADTEIKDAGTYPLTIPAGVVTRVSDGVAYEGGTFEFTVVKEDVVVEPLTVVAVTPAEAVEAIETITIEFSDNVDVPATASGKFTITDAEGNVVATFAAWDAAVEGKVVTLTLTEAITTAGEYTFSFAEGLVTRQGDNATCAYSCTITVTIAIGIDGIIGEAGDATIYDLTGRKVEKINGSGIYIVNGKKVFVK